MKTKYYFIFGLIILFSNSIFSQAKQNEILLKDAQGNATFIKFNETKVTSSDSSIKSFLRKQYKLNDNIDFKSKKGSITEENGIEARKLQQYYNGIKVEFNEIVIVSKNGRVRTINGKGLNINNLDINPKLSENEALIYLLKKIGAERYAWEDESYEKLIKTDENDINATNYPKGELVIMDRNLFDDTVEPILVYKLEVYAIKPLSKSFYYVDASNGEIILEDAIIKHIQGTAQTRYSGQRIIETQYSGNSYRLRDYTRGSGIETYNMNRGTNYLNAIDFTDNDNIWTSTEYHNSNKDDAALDAHWGAEKTYDYFLQTHNRNSYNNNGGVLKNYVHADLVGMGFLSNDNAFWDGQRMTYGDGQYSFDPLTSIDVIAHEIGHGVCSSSANLLYQGESGAINEGLSDIWGAMVEYYADPTKQTYLIGEEITLNGGPLRSMSNPNSRNQPDTYGGTYWLNPNCGTPSNANDKCGVHTNSGILNYWFYLLSEGGSGTNDIGNAFTINSIGKEKAAKIIYRAETVYFTSTTTYSQARLLTIQAAEDLYGESSIESSMVCLSWYAVGLGDNNCNVNIELTGNTNICNTSNYTYTLNYLPPTSSTNWSVTSNIQIVNSNNTSITIKPINTTINDLATITATISGISVIKEIWIGKPKISIDMQAQANSINYVDVFLVGYQSDIMKQNVTSIIWQKISGNGTFGGYPNDYEAFGSGSNNTWTVDAKVTVGNTCGIVEEYFTVTPPAPGACPNITFNGQSIIIEDPCNPINGLSEINLIESILVYDFKGNLVGKYSSKNTNISSLPGGIYIIKVKLTSGEILTNKIIK